MRPKTFLIDPDNSDDNGLFTAQAVGGAGALTLDGALISGGTFTAADGYARRIAQITAGNDAGITFTYVGTDHDGKALTEILAGGAGTPSTETTTGYFKTVTSVTASGAAAGNVTIGTSDEFSTKTVPLNHYSSEAATMSIENISGTLDVTLQESFSEVQDSTKTVDWFPVSALTNVSADKVSPVSLHASAVRIISNSYTDTAQFNWVLRSGN